MTGLTLSRTAAGSYPRRAPPMRGNLRADAGHSLEVSGNHVIRLLVFTTLYPSAERPGHGVFIEERLRHLVRSGRVTATVVAPVPWFPFAHRRFGSYAACARTPASETRHGIRVLHPRYPVVPKIGMNIAPALLYRAVRPLLRTLAAREKPFDLIDAHYFYPDGVAAVKLGAMTGKPVVISARGSDVNLIARYRSPRRQIRTAARQASAIIAVAHALKEQVTALGADPDKVTVLRNGVDLRRFHPQGDRLQTRATLNLQGPVWLAVGHLVTLKGVDITIRALADVPDATLMVAGDGPEKAALQQLAGRLNVADRVRFLGPVAHDDLCRYYNAADAMVLASSREGMPNVVLESLACGTPVIATSVGGIPELITCDAAGRLMHDRSPHAVISAWRRLCKGRPDRAATRAFAKRLGWQPVIEAQCALYGRVLAMQHRGEKAQEVTS